MIAVFPAAPSSPLVMAALAALTGAVPTAAWGQGSSPGAPTGNASAQASAPAVGAPVPLLPPAIRAAPTPAAPTHAAPTQAVGSQNTDRTPVMMTDSPEYCASLGGRVEDMARDAKASSEAADLMREGQRLCEGGKTRVGVQHLRRAFIMLRQTNTDR